MCAYVIVFANRFVHCADLEQDQVEHVQDIGPCSQPQQKRLKHTRQLGVPIRRAVPMVAKHSVRPDESSSRSKWHDWREKPRKTWTPADRRLSVPLKPGANSLLTVFSKKPQAAASAGALLVCVTDLKLCNPYFVMSAGDSQHLTADAAGAGD